MKNEFCPAYCHFDPDSPEPGIRKTCEACTHFTDEVFADRKSGTVYGQDIELTGQNGDYFYYEKDRGDFTEKGQVNKKQVK